MKREPRPTSLTARDLGSVPALEVTLRTLMMAAYHVSRDASAMARRVARRYRAMTGYSILSHNGVDR